MNLDARHIYDTEYGHSMKAEINQTLLKSQGQVEGGAAGESLAKASAFGSFFASVN